MGGVFVLLSFHFRLPMATFGTACCKHEAAFLQFSSIYINILPGGLYTWYGSAHRNFVWELASVWFHDGEE